MGRNIPYGLAGTMIFRHFRAESIRKGRSRCGSGLRHCFRSCWGWSALLSIFLLVLFPGWAMGGAPEVCISLQDDPVQAQTDFTLELRTVDYIPDAFSVMCTTYFDPQLVSFKTLSRGFIGVHEDGRFDLNVPFFMGLPAGTLITSITWRAANPGQNVIGPISCVYTNLNNEVAPLNIDAVQINISGQEKVYGDIDDNGEVDGQDLYQLAVHISGTACFDEEACTGDLNNSNRVNWEDIALFASGFGSEDN